MEVWGGLGRFGVVWGVSMDPLYNLLVGSGSILMFETLLVGIVR